MNPRYLKDSEMYSVCPWKGQASYHSLEVDGQVNFDAAWFYSDFYSDPKRGRCRSGTASRFGAA